ncbi:hydrogenase nickel incorporation protein HypB [Actinotalea sp. M2MS4P-6]|uniref:hydrogenase nickel incorporation protein HypB n=1 Tax=Actinotalea sp. M2MS4P-6 TaxID=2983762 RepID=UPI0021E4D3E6|nr:hydrogenase nickel incorporation protein HypB [Actinotalea sp. M2MS4P-6]MCV2394688.1 hydrogenase nickel incorporation protein HypB [Actinotalea sp. M2MS4P-6]
MCDTCGCGATDVRVVDPASGAVTHTHDGVTHTHTPDEPHSHDGGLTFHTHDAPPAEHAVSAADPVGGHAHTAPSAEPVGGHAHTAPSAEPVGGHAHTATMVEPAAGHAHTATMAEPAGHEHTTTMDLELDVLGKNDALAATTRAWLAEHDIVALNLMSSPGSGKTTLLERTIRETSDRPVLVVEGDQETLLDAERIRAAGARAVQVNTGAGCHLDAEMLQTALQSLAPEPGSLVMVENVGNLVCPALFDLGEAARVVVISVTEGDDKPLKYPHMFAAADLVVVNKTDLLPYVDFDVEALTRHARTLRPGVEVLPLSAKTGENLDAWYAWLDARRP